jgi:hypothetical protein
VLRGLRERKSCQPRGWEEDTVSVHLKVPRLRPLVLLVEIVYKFKCAIRKGYSCDSE